MLSEVGSVCPPPRIFRHLYRSILIFRTIGDRGLTVSKGTGRVFALYEEGGKKQVNLLFENLRSFLGE